MLSTPSSSIILLPWRRNIPLLVEALSARESSLKTPQDHTVLKPTASLSSQPQGKKINFLPLQSSWCISQENYRLGKKPFEEFWIIQPPKDYLQRQIYSTTPKRQDYIHNTPAFGVSENIQSVLLAYCFVLHELHLKSCDLASECIDLLTCSVLIDHHLVLNISSPVGIFQSV